MARTLTDQGPFKPDERIRAACFYDGLDFGYRPIKELARAD